MGPRHGRRGKLSARQREAVPCASLQWVHGMVAVGNARRAGSQGTNSQGASMGPRHGRRGKRERPPSINDTARWASMGPRHGRRGKRSSSDSLRVGRSCFNGSTAWSPWETEGGRHGEDRQYGFNGSTAWSPWETGHSCQQMASVVGFNGSTAWSPWETTICAFERRDKLELQWVHGMVAVGNRRDVGAVAWVGKRFNGSTAWSPWETQSTASSIFAKIPGFNGSTAWSPWETITAARRNYQIVAASMGPRHGRRGKPRARHFISPRTPNASMGPRHGRRGKPRLPSLLSA